MMSASFVKAAALVGLCIFAAGLMRPAHASHRCEDYGLKPVGLFAEGQPAEQFVSETRNKGGVAEFIEKLGIKLSVDQLSELLGEINENPIPNPNLTRYNRPLPIALQGIGGFTTSLLLQRLIFIKGEPISEKVLYGKIRDYTFDDKTKSGHLNVDTCIDDRKTGERELFHWDVEILAKGFTVTQRDDAIPEDPFSLLPDFQMPAAALDRNNRHSIWHRGLDQKLGAKGSSIKVHNVYYRKLSNAIRQQFVRIRNPDPNDPNDPAHRFYTSTADSCIDLFTQGYPPATIGELVDNDYCLGRCKHPAIYNSGD